MPIKLIVFLAFGLFIQAVILFVEIFINLKRPLLLKVILLTLSLGFAWRGIGFLYSYYYNYNRWAIELPLSLLSAASICFFAHIYESKLKWYIISFGLFMFVTQLLFQLYYSFIDPVEVSIPLWSLPGVRGNVAAAIAGGIVIKCSANVGVSA